MTQGLREMRSPPADPFCRRLSRPAAARTRRDNGPTVRPVWYLWEERAFWWLTGSWSRLPAILERDARVALVVDTCDLETGEVLQVVARGTVDVLNLDLERARRWGSRYLGPDERAWGRFRSAVYGDPSTRFLLLAPASMRANDLSYSPAS